ncbi:MAG: hypothetical protein UH850_07765, partial [Paludibacteraceae bacterium]|nr:hypothetical protein [Paludibacteraceae bacterium]
ASTKKLIKPQRIKVYREKLRFYMRKRDENPIRKWNMISRLQFIELTLNNDCHVRYDVFVIIVGMVCTVVY